MPGRVRNAVFGAALLALAAVPASAVVGDCNGTGEVEITDLVTAINVTLDGTPLPAERCGNNVVNNDEQCDDGNQDTGDGCDGECRFEGIGVLDQYWSGYRPGTCG